MSQFFISSQNTDSRLVTQHRKTNRYQIEITTIGALIILLEHERLLRTLVSISIIVALFSGSF